MRRAKPQLEMFERCAHRRSGEYESPRLYAAVLRLRRAGRKAYRISGCAHLVDGKILTSRQLFVLASYVAPPPVRGPWDARA